MRIYERRALPRITRLAVSTGDSSPPVGGLTEDSVARRHRFPWARPSPERGRLSFVDRAATSKQLTWAALALLASLVLHDLDHLRQGRSIEPFVVGLGVVGDISTLTMVALVIRGHRFAPHAAVLVGFANFFGFIGVHVVPDWGPLSDGYPGLPVDTLSWVIVFVPMAAALWLGVTGLSQLRTRRAPAAV